LQSNGKGKFLKNLHKWLSEKSTWGGILGLVVTGSAAFGADWATDAETVNTISTAAPMVALPLLSLLAMFIKEA
jgi:protein involved in ribonucleotide reduction